VAIYRAVCVSVMLYGCEAWTLYRRHIKAFEAFHIRSLQSILGIRWWQKIPHTELFEKAGITPAEHLLLQRQLRWLGHVIRMPDNWLPRRLLYGELTVGQRSVGRPKKCFINHIKANLLKCNIKPSDLEALASDRDIWRTVCDTGLMSFLTGWITTSEELRAAHHAASTKLSSVQQSLCFRIRTAEPHVVPREVWQHLVTVQCHRQTRRTSAAAAAHILHYNYIHSGPLCTHSAVYFSPLSMSKTDSTKNDINLSLRQTINVIVCSLCLFCFCNSVHCLCIQATSKLLVNYPEQERSQILDFLFKVP